MIRRASPLLLPPVTLINFTIHIERQQRWRQRESSLQKWRHRKAFLEKWRHHETIPRKWTTREGRPENSVQIIPGLRIDRSMRRRKRNKPLQSRSVSDALQTMHTHASDVSEHSIPSHLIDLSSHLSKVCLALTPRTRRILGASCNW